MRAFKRTRGRSRDSEADFKSILFLSVGYQKLWYEECLRPYYNLKGFDHLGATRGRLLFMRKDLSIGREEKGGKFVFSQIVFILRKE